MDNSKGMSIAALVLGIVACVIPWWGIAAGIIGLICGIVGLVLAVNARKKNPSGMATAALILSIIGIVLSVIGLIACGICACAAAATSTAIENGDIDLSNIEDALESVANEIATTIAGN